MPKPFKGVINVDVRDSIADWDPYLAERRRTARRTC